MQGSIQKRVGKRGVTWTALVDLPRDPVTGKRRQKRISAKTKKEAERLLNQAINELQNGSYIEPSTATLAEYLDRWLEAAAPTVKPNTIDRYRRIAERKINPVLGSIPLSKLSPLAIQDFYAGLLAGGLSPSTVALHHAILHRALDQAVKWRLIPHNPANAVDTPRPNPPEMQTWTAEEARAFLNATAGDKHAALYVLALHTGMRLGEMIGLRWGDIDFERGTLAVRRTVTHGNAGLTIGTPKTAAGKRSIALPAPCLAALRSHRAAQAARRLQLGPAWQDGDYVFDRGDGTFLHPNVVGKAFQRHVERAGLPRIRFHDLRHTAATLMLANGEHPKIVQERLGHSDISMTLNRYSHVSMDMQRDAADRLAALLGS